MNFIGLKSLIRPAGNDICILCRFVKCYRTWKNIQSYRRSQIAVEKTRKRNSQSSLITNRGLVILSRYMSTAYKRVTPPAAALTRSTAICSSFKQKMIWINWDSSLIGIKRAEIRISICACTYTHNECRDIYKSI